MTRTRTQSVPLAAALTLMFVACLMLWVFALPAGASVASGRSSAASPVLATPSQSLQELQDKARQTRATMSRLDAEMQELTQQWNESRRQLDEINQRLGVARRALERSESDLERQRDVLAARMNTIYKTGEYSWLDLIVSAPSMADAEVMVDTMTRISELDKEQEVELDRLTGEAQRLEQQIESDRDEAISVQADIEEQRAKMSQKIAEREAVLKDVVAQIKKILADPMLLMKSGGEVTQVTWAQAFLKSLRVKSTRDNLAAVVAWEMAEGGHWYNTAHYNPLNTSQPMPGARTFNSHGVKIYTSWSQGLKATVITINNGLYGDILAALRAGNDGQAVASAVAASPWGTGSFTVKE